MSINAIKSQIFAMKQANVNIKTDVKEEKQQETTNQTSNNTQQKQISAEDVFKYMSATSTKPVQMKRTTTVNVQAYVNEESASRIASSMQDFESQFASKLSTVKSEFGNISDKLAEKIALSMF